MMWTLVAIAVVVWFLGSAVVELLVNLTWFDAQGYLQVYRTILLTEIGIGVAGGIFAALFLFVNLLFALRQIGDPAQYLPPEIVVTPVGQFLGGGMVRRTALVISLGIGVMVGMTVASGWERVLLFLNGVPFGTVDPVFERDVGFYIFTLPLLDSLQSYFFTIGLFSLLGVGVVYFIKMQAERSTSAGVINLSDVSRPARSHVALLGAFLLALWAWGLYLSRFGQMHLAAGLFTGPGFADINGTLPILAIKVVIVLIAAGVVVYGLIGARYRLLFGAVGLIAVVWVGGFLYTSVLQRFVVSPNELEKERIYLEHNIVATNRSFALDKVTERSLTEDTVLTEQDIANNQGTITNIRLWDHEPLLDTFSQIQEIRTYYDFVSVDNDRYIIDGELRQTMLSPRELNPESLPSRTWVNERLTYTHGYGLTLGPVNRVNEQGLPVLFVKDLPPKSTSPILKITRPEIYYGEVAPDYVFVNTRQKEFNYPEGDSNIFSTYEGEGGIGLGSLYRRLLLTAFLRDKNILFADDFTPETGVLLFRNVAERVQKIAPFFRYDQDPYLVIHKGALVWILDAYTLSDRYPYGEIVPELGNYMRNPVKVVVDAYNGTVTFYLVDSEDPIAETYGRIFPGLIRPISDMDADLRAHLRHPVDYFTVQTLMYATYHMREVNTFYNKEDQWEVPVLEQKAMEPYFTVMKLPGEQKEEFILMLPFTPILKDNLAAWMVARSDGENYGQLVVYKFPKQKLIFGPRQMVARMNQDAEVSQQITLWDQAGSNVVRGTLLVIPIESSLIYIQPLYLKAEDGRIPELKRVLVGYQNEIAMGIDLDDALSKIFRPDRATAIGKTGAERQVAAALPQAAQPLGGAPGAQALGSYENLQRASQRGDWARFGRELDALGEILRKMAREAQ